MRLSPSIKSLIVDTLLIVTSCLILVVLIQNALNFLLILVGVEVIFRSALLLLFKCHKIQLEDITSRDIGTLIKSQFIASLLIVAITYGLTCTFHSFEFGDTLLLETISTVELIHFSFISLALIARRSFVYNNSIRSKSKKELTRAVLYGGKTMGKQLLTSFAKDDSIDFEIIAMVDEDPSLKGTMILGRRIVFPNYIKTNWQKDQIDLVIFTEDAQSEKSEILNFCLENRIKVLEIPPMSRWVSQEFNAKQLKSIRIKELLGRNAISLNQNEVSQNIEDKVILVTGAAGSIGNGIVEQIISFKPKRIILIDQSETGLYNTSNELKRIKYDGELISIICDINNFERLRSYFKFYQPEVVFHAAAYKHVPLMENNPLEAIETNIFGSLNVANLADEFQCETFVMISTDKAVNPTNVMGATKRAAEIFTQQIASKSKTKFIITRFGNVLGSNGSVIPLFEKQIKEGGPITLTDERITRFFMTIPEACQLVLEAGTIGKGGEIFVFDMGEPVKIKDLAEKMIQLSGLELNRDITIKTIGLRPGEKLYEELLNQSELTDKTNHPKILIGKSIQPSQEEMTIALLSLKNALEQNEIISCIKTLKTLIPEYKSNNSKYEDLD